MPGSRTLLGGVVAAAAVIGLVGLIGVFYFGNDDYQYHLTNVTGSQPSLRVFGAKNTAGESRSAQDYAGEIVVLYMGYTHCPDVCPTTLATLHAALQTLGKPTASHIQVLFETVDPKRDSLALMKRYTRTFDPRFRGLWLAGDALDKLESRYHISVSYGQSDANGDYQVNHSSGVFVFDGNGEMRLIGSGATAVSDWAADLRHLVSKLD